MGPLVALRTTSNRKRLIRRDTLERLAGRICAGEEVVGEVEISVLFCDDAAITELNRRYRRKNEATDVLSFEQEGPAQSGGPRPLGDIVISLETAERNCGGDRVLMRREIELLFCHGLLHLLGYDHGTLAERKAMQRKQAEYLYTSDAEAWLFGPKAPRVAGTHRTGPAGGSRRIGRGQ